MLLVTRRKGGGRRVLPGGTWFLIRATITSRSLSSSFGSWTHTVVVGVGWGVSSCRFGVGLHTSVMGYSLSHAFFKIYAKIELVNFFSDTGYLHVYLPRSRTSPSLYFSLILSFHYFYSLPLVDLRCEVIYINFRLLNTLWYFLTVTVVISQVELIIQTIWISWKWNNSYQYDLALWN